MDIVTLVLAKKFATKVAAGFSNVVANDETSSIDFTLNDGTKTSLTFPKPKDGVSVTDIYLEGENVYCKFSNDEVQLVGPLPKQSFAISKDAGNGINMHEDGIYMSATDVDISQEEGNIIEAKEDGLYAKGGNSNEVELTYEEYKVLPESQKMDGTNYFVKDYPSGSGDGGIRYNEENDFIQLSVGGEWKNYQYAGMKPAYKLIPIMTSNTSPKGSVSRENDSFNYSSDTSRAGNNDNLYLIFTEQTADTKHCIFYSAENQNDGSLIYEFDETVDDIVSVNLIAGTYAVNNRPDYNIEFLIDGEWIVALHDFLFGTTQGSRNYLNIKLKDVYSNVQAVKIKTCIEVKKSTNSNFMIYGLQVYSSNSKYHDYV